MCAPIIATAIAGTAIWGMRGAEETVLLPAIDEGLVKEGVVAASRVFGKPEHAMTHLRGGASLIVS